jgi:Lrp/AsnC family leucine-responsive transcriptional regulator
MTKLTSVDRRILTALQRDASISNVALAEQIGMSPSPCLRRVKQLEESGIIRRYVALLDRHKVGIGIAAFVEVKVPQVPGKPIVDEFTRAVQAEPSVVGCYLIAGQFDFLLQIVAQDINAYAALTQNVLMRLPGVQDLRSSFVLRPIKDSTELPIL